MSANSGSGKFGRIILACLAPLAIWCAWESAIRIIIFHDAWTPSTALKYLFANLIFFLVCALILAFAYRILLILFHRKSQARTTTAICFSLAFLVMVSLFLRLRLWIPESKPWVHYLASAALLLAAFSLSFWLLLRLLPLVKLNGKFALASLLVPIVLVFAVPSFRNYRFQQKHHNASGVHHIILISVDTLRFDYVHAYGAKQVRTPVMDGIAANGILFENAISSIPQTGPSHISMLTGMPPLTHGVLVNGQRLPSHVRTLAQELRDAGYRTAAFVSGFPLKIPNCGLDRAFQIYNDRLSFMDRFEDIDLGKFAALFPVFDFGVYRLAPEVTESVLPWLSDNADHPFFLFLHYYDPHYPYGIKAERRHTARPMWLQIPPSDVERQRQLYAGEVETVDSQLQRIVDFLKSRRIYDNTLLIVTADHGESLGEHNYFYDHKGYVYEQLIRVPLIIRYPQKIHPGQVFQPQVALFDIYNTILQASAIGAKKQSRSFDLIKLATSPPEGYDRKIVSINFNYNIRSLRTENWKLIETKKRNRFLYELYDLKTDPQELRNVFQDHTDLGHQLITDLHNGIAAESGSMRNQQENLTPEQIEGLRSLGYLN